jgi:hypothetical protein
MKLEYSAWILEKYSNIKYNKNSTRGSLVVSADGLIDRRDEANNSLSRFYESA